jgi:hypothetical protein
MHTGKDGAGGGAQRSGHFVAAVNPHSAEQGLGDVQQLDVGGRHLGRRLDGSDRLGYHVGSRKILAMLPPSTKTRSRSSGMALAIFIRSRSKSDPGHSLPMRIFAGPSRA